MKNVKKFLLMMLTALLAFSCTAVLAESRLPHGLQTVLFQTFDGPQPSRPVVFPEKSGSVSLVDSSVGGLGSLITMEDDGEFYLYAEKNGAFTDAKAILWYLENRGTDEIRLSVEAHLSKKRGEADEICSYDGLYAYVSDEQGVWQERIYHITKGVELEAGEKAWMALPLADFGLDETRAASITRLKVSLYGRNMALFLDECQGSVYGLDGKQEEEWIYVDQEETDMESSIVRITGYTKLQAITDRRPAFGSTAPGAWTELPPFPVFNGEKAVITTKLSAIFDLKPGKTVLDTSCFDIAGGEVITGPAYKNLETHQMYDPENVPDGLYWRRNYCGIFGSYILDDVFYAVIHGENKNEIVDGKYYKTNVKPLTTQYSGDSDFSGVGKDGKYRDAWHNYFNFLAIQWAPVDELHENASLLNHDEGPIVWPADGYIFTFNGKIYQACDGIRHPSVYVDDEYIYVYYLDSSSANFGINVARAPIASKGLPGSFMKYYKGEFSQPALPEGFDKDDYSFLSVRGAPSTPVVKAHNPIRFSVAKIKDTDWYVGVLEDLENGYNTIKISVSKDLVTWCEPVEIPGVGVADGWSEGNLHDPCVYNLDFTSATEVSADGFYIVGTSMAADPERWPITQWMKVAIEINE
ncbi:MAG: hypothetical protein E7324_02260 [Clostridiales bacterium]|nr:hypothetical protein [Clostridiales bacterium]